MHLFSYELVLVAVSAFINNNIIKEKIQGVHTSILKQVMKPCH